MVWPNPLDKKMSDSFSFSLPGYLRAHLPRVARGLSLVLVHSMIAVGAPFITRFAVDGLVEGGLSWWRLMAYAAGYLLAVAAAAATGWTMRRMLLGLGHQVEYEIRRDIFDRLTGLDYHYFSRERTGDLMTKMTSDLTAVREWIGQGVLQSARTTAGFLFSFGVMFSINAQLAWVMLLLLPCTSILFFLLLKLIRKRYEAGQAQFSVISNFCQESFGGIRTIRGYGVEQRQESMFQALNRRYIDLQMALSRVERPIWPGMGMLFSVGVALILWVGGRQVLEGSLTIGEFVQFSQYLFILQWPMLALGWTVNMFQRGMASWRRIHSILAAEPVIRDPGHVTGIGPVRGDIVFDRVRVVLGDVPVLQGIDLRIAQGETIGITGPTGSGKTVLAWLIARVIDPDEGHIRIGEYDLRDIPLDELRRAVGLAPQEAFLFSDTLANNIAFGLPHTNLENVFAAAEVAALRAEVEAFPDRFDTVLGERGVTLSGGQRQRTAISRAIARNPEILILDDVFSAIDTQTEAAIQARLHPVIEGRTTLIISHRITSLRHADRILVLEGGRITQSGTHAELVRAPGYYRDLDEVQRLEARLEHTA